LELKNKHQVLVERVSFKVNWIIHKLDLLNICNTVKYKYNLLLINSLLIFSGFLGDKFQKIDLHCKPISKNDKIYNGNVIFFIQK